ncbi:cell division protein FtsQ/DivIB [Enterococcus columbae]|uniref:Cell division protein DivIB n=1 Tax=Enterococcus columbae DSM 7374 = ATCC 51263 TaxID=1121865 RepID=S0KLZ3_9ENTE|nr:cell division protein FtsQ/DivIB [Enterococcus columbae]EOT42035.1 hypothetical protein OMW_01149 [Enterococcus columbae DSM 7374 = ATCC 51263]EOW80592.1 hypothetical protein I568_01769 [Enterococcus columbae DSM 7374 = ATCC 51263]OJG26331.1 hypothetical protein RR47_GL000079 [Enterococcus columbae DSM 7374 = ATCC 51263]
MNTITKKTKQAANKSQKNQHLNESKKLTPWQEAHQRYLEEKRLMDELMAKQEEKTLEEQADAVTPDELEDETNATLEGSLLNDKAKAEKEKTSFSDKLPKMKDYRQKKLFRRLGLIVGILAIPLIFCLYYISPLGQLAKVEVSGNKAVNAQAIVQTAQFKVGEPLWEQYFNRDKNETRVKKLSPWIKSVSVSITDFNHFKLEIKEYPEVAYLLKDNRYYTILENGKVIDQSTDQPQATYPILEGFKKQTTILKTLQAYERLSQEIKQSISQIKSTPRSDNNELLTLIMNDGNQVLINRDQLVQRMPYYAQVAANLTTPGVVDMEVGIFSYPYPSTSESSSDSTEATTSSEVTE